MVNKMNIPVTIQTRGDDIKILNELQNLISIENEAITSYIAYLKCCFIEKLSEEGESFSKEYFPIGHSLGYSFEEMDNWINKNCIK